MLLPSGKKNTISHPFSKYSDGEKCLGNKALGVGSKEENHLIQSEKAIEWRMNR